MEINVVVSKDSLVMKDAFLIRKAVFTDEQGFFDELDSVDDISYNAVAYADGKVVGCGRMFHEEESTYHIGRIAVLREYRKLFIGSVIMNALEQKAKSIGAEYVVLSAQKRAWDFYLKLGYIMDGAEYLEEGYPHIFMRKKI